jgi:3'(2'), 5'-bisphosphate nucleotidase
MAERLAEGRDPELDEVIRIARIATLRVSDVYATDFAVELKAEGDPVTRADRESSEIICASLTSSFPGDAILSEEAVPASPDVVGRLVSSPRVWFVDPLDGTREFSKRIGEFAVMIGLAVAGRAHLGVVVIPSTGDLVAGRAGAGAFVEDVQGKRRAVSVSTLSDPREATLFVSRSHRPPLIGSLIEQLGLQRVVPCGSVGVKIARLVLGEGDVYVHDGGGAKRWDACAPEAVLVAAGGSFSDLDGGAIDYASADLVLRRGIVATNGVLQEAVLSACRRMGRRQEAGERPRQIRGS